MFVYYFALALRSLRRSVALTVLVIAAIGIGIGASMTMLTIFLALSSDPIPGKSAELYAPQIDNWGPIPGRNPAGTPDKLPAQLSYQDAQALMHAHAANRQAAMYMTAVAVTPADAAQAPFRVAARATYADFFSMFDVPFRYGAPWDATDDAARTPIVVITRALNDRVFDGADSVGRLLMLGTDNYRIVGVINEWDPSPRFFDLDGSLYGGEAQVYLPLSVAVDRHLDTDGNRNCQGPLGTGEEAILHSECIWLQFWVQLPSASAVRAYGMFLHNYAAEQQRTGRFNWPAHTALRSVSEWLRYRQVVPTELRVLMAASFSFLFVCLVNAMGLMLAKFSARASSVSVRRALGAQRSAIFAQCLVEAGVIGLAGALVGLGLTVLGLLGAESLLPSQPVRLDSLDVVLTVAVAVGATLLAGLYPTWRSAQLQPAWLLKTQ